MLNCQQQISGRYQISLICLLPNRIEGVLSRDLRRYENLKCLSTSCRRTQVAAEFLANPVSDSRVSHQV
jgi:hypothetical protein